MTYYKAGNTAKAEQFFNKAFELDPSLKVCVSPSCPFNH
ncbi:MAG: tetratricopeptide repeat protein [Bacteroidota bacterium]|nr:MAG: tetratricopeptide repeat protein [Bacteroidota bacterium]